MNDGTQRRGDIPVPQNSKAGGWKTPAPVIKAKDGEFFISDWPRIRNTVEFPGIRETAHNPDFNSGEFAEIKSQAGLNSYKLNVKEWAEKTNAIAIRQIQTLTARTLKQLERGAE